MSRTTPQKLLGTASPAGLDAQTSPGIRPKCSALRMAYLWFCKAHQSLSQKLMSGTGSRLAGNLIPWNHVVDGHFIIYSVRIYMARELLPWKGRTSQRARHRNMLKQDGRTATRRYERQHIGKIAHRRQLDACNCSAWLMRGLSCRNWKTQSLRLCGTKATCIRWPFGRSHRPYCYP